MMSFKNIFYIIILSNFIFNQYLDTDCYRIAGNTVDNCKQFTTFINGTEDNFYIEPNILYLCCYVEFDVNKNFYNGCMPIKEDVVFADKKEFNFNCFSNFIRIEKIFKIFSLIFLYYFNL